MGTRDERLLDRVRRRLGSTGGADRLSHRRPVGRHGRVAARLGRDDRVLVGASRAASRRASGPHHDPGACRHPARVPRSPAHGGETVRRRRLPAHRRARTPPAARASGDAVPPAASVPGAHRARSRSSRRGRRRHERHAQVDVGLARDPGGGAPHRRALGLRGARMGRVLGVGSDRERGPRPVARRDRGDARATRTGRRSACRGGRARRSGRQLHHPVRHDRLAARVRRSAIGRLVPPRRVVRRCDRSGGHGASRAVARWMAGVDIPAARAPRRRRVRRGPGNVRTGRDDDARRLGARRRGGVLRHLRRPVPPRRIRVVRAGSRPIDGAGRSASRPRRDRARRHRRGRKLDRVDGDGLAAAR